MNYYNHCALGLQSYRRMFHACPPNRALRRDKIGLFPGKIWHNKFPPLSLGKNSYLREAEVFQAVSRGAKQHKCNKARRCQNVSWHGMALEKTLLVVLGYLFVEEEET